MTTRMWRGLGYLVVCALWGRTAPVVAGEQAPPKDGSGGPATVVTATFLGSAGNEWLSAGGFLPDGTILLCGVSLDPELALCGVKAAVIGKDAPPLPVLKAWRRLSSVATGKTALPTLADALSAPDSARTAVKGVPDQLKTNAEEAREKKQQEDERLAMGAVPGELRWSENDTIEKATVYRKLSWMDLEATAFLARCSSDLKQVLSLYRLPRGAGSITSAAVGADGAIYIAGGATDRIAGASEDVQRLPELAPGTAMKLPDSVGPLVYTAKVSPDLSRILWVRTSSSEMFAPRLRVLASGELAVASPDVRVFTPAGEVRRSHKVSRARYIESISFNPVTGGYTKGGDFMTKTGREPYRTPYAFVYRPDGSQEMTLFNWTGPLVGLDSLRLEADAQVLRTAYDDQGNLIVFSKSHGGNNVQVRYPYDIDRYMPNGLGALAMSSPGCILKVGPDFNLLGAGVWNDPGFVQSVGYGADGSVAWTGLTAHARRVNAVSEATDGIFAFVASPRLDAFRFGSAMPACGKRVVLEGTTGDWGIVTGRLASRPMLMFLTGAFGEEKSGDKRLATPLRNPVQPAFGGGLMDGYVLLLDLSPAGAPAEAAVSAKPKLPPAGEKNVVKNKPPLVAAEGQVFRLGGERYVNVQLTLREQPETGLWPRFFYGRADKDGTFTYSTQKAGPAAFVLRAEHLEQDQGNQVQRLFGTLLANRREANEGGKAGEKRVLPAEIFLEVQGLSAWRLQEERQETGDSVRINYRPVSTVTGRLHFGAQTVAVENAACSAHFSVPRKVDVREPGIKPNLANMTIHFTVTGRDLGLGPPWAEKNVLVRFACTGYSDVKYESLQPTPPPPMVDPTKVQEISPP